MPHPATSAEARRLPGIAHRPSLDPLADRSRTCRTPRDRRPARRWFRWMPLALLGGSLAASPAAGFTFVSAEGSGIPNAVTHQIGFNGTGGAFSISVGIDPTSANAAAMEVSVRNALTTWNELVPTTGNLVRDSNLVPFNDFDFESVFLHEMGHAMGLDHPNLASESGLPQDEQDFTKALPGPNGVFDVDAGADGVIGSADDQRGDDVNLNWFNRANNNPFVLPDTVDATTFSVNAADLPAGDSFSANGSRDVAELLAGVPDNTEAVMQQGTVNGEAQRDLTADDVAGILFARTGLDSIAGTADDYTATLQFVGADANADIVVDFDNSVAFAATGRAGVFLGGNDFALTSASIDFNDTINWHFNDVLRDEHRAWAGPAGVGAFEDGDNWTAGTTANPDVNWVVDLANQTISGGQTAEVTTDQAVRRATVRGPGGRMTLRVDESGSLDVGESLTLEAGGELAIRGTVTTDTFQADPLSDLALEIAGVNNLGTLTVNGAADLAGALNIDLVDGFLPVAGDVFDLFDFNGTVSGLFDAVNLPTLAGDLLWDDAALLDAGELSVFRPGDLNGDGVVDGLDIDPFVALLTGGGFDAAADLNADGAIDGLDIDPFVQLLTGSTDTAGAAIPEPTTAALLTLAGLTLLRRRKP